MAYTSLYGASLTKKVTLVIPISSQWCGGYRICFLSSFYRQIRGKLTGYRWAADRFVATTNRSLTKLDTHRHIGMSFCFEWPQFDAAFVNRAREELEQALNKGIKTTNICDKIHVKSLYMGSQPPELDILEIGDLSEEKFRGMFRLTYEGDAHVILQTRVQVNPLYEPMASDDKGWMFGPMEIVAAQDPLVVPLELCISQVRIRGFVVLLFSWARGLSISFKNDPLEQVVVDSTFNTLPSIHKYLQNEIERRLGNLFREEIPRLAHKLTLNTIRKFGESIPSPLRASPLGSTRLRHSRTASLGLTNTNPRTNSRPETPSTTSSKAETNNHEGWYYARYENIIIRVIGKDFADPTSHILQFSPGISVKQLWHRLWKIFVTNWSDDSLLFEAETGKYPGLRELLVTSSLQPIFYRPSTISRSILEEQDLDTPTRLGFDDVNEAFPPLTASLQYHTHYPENRRNAGHIDTKKISTNKSLQWGLQLMRTRCSQFTPFYFAPELINIYYRSSVH